jgi:ATPase family associated with various cellular activities (AAA)
MYTHPGDHLADLLARMSLVLDRLAVGDAADAVGDAPDAVARIDVALDALDEAIAERVATTEIALPVVDLARRFGLPACAVRLLVAAALPGLDVALAERWRLLVGSDAPERHVYELVDLFAFERDPGALVDELGADRPLARGGLVHLVSDRAWTREAPLLQRLVTVPDRVVGALRGNAAFDPRLALFATRMSGTPDAALAARIADRGTPIVVTGDALVGKATAIANAAAASGRRAIALRLDVLAASGDALRWLDELACEARLLDDVLVIRVGDGMDALPLTIQRAVVALAQRGDAIVTARQPGAIVRALRAPRVIHIATPDATAQAALWRAELGHDVDVTGVVARCSLPAGEIVEAVAAARSAAEGRAITPDDLVRAARARVQHRLSDVASIASTTLSWTDLVVRDEVMQRILEILAAVHYRDHVLHTWGFADKWPYGRAVTALLAGPPGTGKTMIATLLAKELGLELFRVDLSKVVSKWLGETEKNLGKVFDEAARTGAIVLFDEADALFAKRTEVKSSNDRNANLEVNYLLQRLESHDGIVLLTTNSANSLDEAFKRRLRFRIELAAPDAAEREALWRAMFPPAAPLAGDVDLSALAHRFKMAGGHIKNAVVRAAFLAAQRGAPAIDHSLLMQAATLEWIELGNLPT